MEKLQKGLGFGKMKVRILLRYPAKAMITLRFNIKEQTLIAKQIQIKNINERENKRYLKNIR